MEQIQKAKSISIWVFIIPFVAVNTCLIITTQLHFLIDGPYRIYSTFPYIDGGVSISRTARYFPTYLIFKPAMFLTTYLLIKYWIYSANIVNHFEENHKYRKKILFFGLASAIALTIHAIFLKARGSRISSMVWPPKFIPKNFSIIFFSLMTNSRSLFCTVLHF